MKTIEVTHASTRPDEVFHYEIVETPVDFEVAETHCELGGMLVVMKNGGVYDAMHGVGPTFHGLWTDCTFHIAVRRWA